MKVEFKTVDELRAFVRGTMLTKMYASVASMKQCGACEEAIEELVADTMEKIEQACDEVSEMFDAAQEEFNAPVTLN
jgi:hypothetical protein